MTKRVLTKTKPASAQIKIRLPETLRARIEQSARDGGISMNSEMVGRLTSSYGDDDHRRYTQMCAEFIEYMKFPPHKKKRGRK